MGEQPKKFIFFRALGEYLPFKNSLFDQVIFATSLDHFIDPIQALLEAKRVMKITGELLVIMGEKNINDQKNKIIHSPYWYEKLKVPSFAEDRFHYKKFGVAEFEIFIKEAGFKISKLLRKPVCDWGDKIGNDQDLSGLIWGDSLFYKLKIK